MGALRPRRLRLAAVVEDLVLARLHPLLPSDPGEEGGELEVVVGAPLLERMVVAAGTLQPQAEEQLRRILHLLVGVGHLAIPDHGRVLPHLAGRREDVADKTGIGHVVGQARPDQLVKRITAVTMQGVVRPLVAEDRRPLVGEEIGVVGAVEQPVDEPVAFGGVGVGEERPRLVERGHASGDVNGGPTQERRIITHARGRQP